MTSRLKRGVLILSGICLAVVAGDGQEISAVREPSYRACESAKATYAADSNARMHLELGITSYYQGDVSRAIKAINDALAIDPCSAKAHYFAWRLESLAGDEQKSLQQLEEAHQLAPADSQVSATWSAVEHAVELAQSNSIVVQVLPTETQTLFFGKHVDCDGIEVKAAKVVANDALVLACGTILRMLRALPPTRKKLANKGGELHVIGEFQQTSDLPENKAFRGKDAYRDVDGANVDLDTRTRGVGGLKSSCGEENLLRLPRDRYREGEDMCVHEFAHEIMNYGFGNRERREIQKAYKVSIGKGLWRGAYSSTNPQEYWATLSMWYFGTHGQFLPSMRPAQVPAPGPEGLKAYDPEGFALVDRLYHGGR